MKKKICIILAFVLAAVLAAAAIIPPVTQKGTLLMPG